VEKSSNEAPVFFDELESKIVLDLNTEPSTYTYILPEVFDMNIYDEVYISVSKLPHFITYSNESLETS
jgi:hypothetical protein